MSGPVEAKPARGLTPRQWKLAAVAYSFVTFVDNLGEVVDWLTWLYAGVSALAFAVLFCVGHRPARDSS